MERRKDYSHMSIIPRKTCKKLEPYFYRSISKVTRTMAFLKKKHERLQAAAIA